MFVRCCVLVFGLTALPVSAAANSPVLSEEARSGISAALGRDLPGYRARMQAGQWVAASAAQRLTATFDSRGIAIGTGNRRWHIALAGYGYGDELQPVQRAFPRGRDNQIEYCRGPLREWYMNGPLGVEQGFTLTAPPLRVEGQRTAHLTVGLDLSGDLLAATDPDGQGLTITGDWGRPVFRYAGLSAFDAGRTALPVWLELRGQRLSLQVDDSRARYPIVIDPLVQLAELTASGGQGGDMLGYSIATTGNTVVVGAPGAGLNQGIAYVYVKPAGACWANMTQTGRPLRPIILIGASHHRVAAHCDGVAQPVAYLAVGGGQLARRTHLAGPSRGRLDEDVDGPLVQVGVHRGGLRPGRHCAPANSRGHA